MSVCDRHKDYISLFDVNKPIKYLDKFQIYNFYYVNNIIIKLC